MHSAWSLATDEREAVSRHGIVRVHLLCVIQGSAKTSSLLTHDGPCSQRRYAFSANTAE